VLTHLLVAVAATLGPMDGFYYSRYDLSTSLRTNDELIVPFIGAHNVTLLSLIGVLYVFIRCCRHSARKSTSQAVGSAIAFGCLSLVACAVGFLAVLALGARISIVGMTATLTVLLVLVFGAQYAMAVSAWETSPNPNEAPSDSAQGPS
jgi:hypothetical protein